MNFKKYLLVIVMNKKILNIIEKQYERDENDRVIINMRINNDDDFLSNFSSTKTSIINSDVAEFIENSCRAVLPKEQLLLRIECNNLDNNTQDKYTQAIKEYYKERFRENEREFKFLNFAFFILAITGILILTFSIFINYKFDSVIWSEVIDIVAWVFLWEAVDIKFFKMRQMRLQRKRYLSFINMKVIFVSE